MENLKKKIVRGLEIFTSGESGSAYGAIIGGREEQQDSCGIFAISEGGSKAEELLLLADGMGGHAGGQIAANLVISEFFGAFSKTADLSAKQRLHSALLAANEALKSRVADEIELEGMGCTLVAAIVSNGSIQWISVGDSHLMVFRDGKLNKLNADHSMAPQIDKRAEDGELSVEQAQNHPDRNVLVSALTGNRIGLIDQGNSKLNDGDLVMLASDGLDTLSENEIASTLAGGQLPLSLVQKLLTQVNEKRLPYQDNTSIVICPGLGSIRSVAKNRNPTFSNWTILVLAMLGVAILASALTWLIFDRQNNQISPLDSSISVPPETEESDSVPGPTPSKEPNRAPSLDVEPINKREIDDANLIREPESQNPSIAKVPENKKTAPSGKTSRVKKPQQTESTNAPKKASKIEKKESETQNEVAPQRNENRSPIILDQPRKTSPEERSSGEIAGPPN